MPTRDPRGGCVITWTDNSLDEDFEIEYNFTQGTPPKLWGRPENCHDGDPDEVEIVIVRDMKGNVRPEILDFIVNNEQVYNRFLDQAAEAGNRMVEDLRAPYW
jgi:hypothetical protein